jgi:transcriptional regulator with XRE-family HTH domain
MLIERVKKMQAAKGLTNKELARLANIPESTVSRMLSGHTESPSLDNVLELVKAMGGSMDYVTGLSDEMFPKAAKEEDIAKVEQLEKELLRQRKWVTRLFVVCLILVGALALALILDVGSPMIGFFRRQ